MKIKIPREGWTPRPHQMAVWADLEAGIENLLLVGHRRWGKDEVGLGDCAVRAARKPANYFYCLPQQEHTRRAIWTSINPHTGVRRVDEAFPAGFRVGPFKEQEMALEVRSAGGKVSRIQFLGSDNYDAIVGGSPYGVYFSEWSIADPQALAILRPIVAENGGFMRFLTTPRGRNHVYRQMNDMRGKPGWAVHYATVNDTGIFTAEKLAAIRAENISLYGPEVGDSLFRQEYYCTFEEVTPGSYYVDLLLRAEKQGRVGDLVYSPEEPVYAAFDLGWADATAIWYAQVRKDNWVDIIGYAEFHRMSVPDMITEELRKRPWSYAALLLPHDARQHQITSGVTAEDILTRNGFACYVMPQTDDNAQIQSVRMLLPRCNFNAEECDRGLTCLRAFHQRYKHDHLDNKIEWRPNPVHDWSSHAAKALATLAYFAPTLRRGATRAPVADHDFLGTDRPGVSSERGLGWMK
ncbi:MAG: hypothetical protein ACRD1P_08490 [Thermoanaerobaculia bacterium]